MARIMLTGSRQWGNFDKFKAVVGCLRADAVKIVGDCPTGLDSMVREFLTPVEVFRADWNTHGKSAGPLRNQAMVDSGADLCIAFIRADQACRGTRDAMARARRAGVPVLEILD